MSTRCSNTVFLSKKVRIIFQPAVSVALGETNMIKGEARTGINVFIKSYSTSNIVLLYVFTVVIFVSYKL